MSGTRNSGLVVASLVPQLEFGEELQEHLMGSVMICLTNTHGLHVECYQ